MARPWRIQFEGAVYHIMSRGVGRQTIFLDNKDYLQFLQYLERAVEKFSLDIFAFVLMSNHYHLLLRILQKNLSRFLQWLQTSYAVYYNRRHNHIGHLFQGRYKSILVGEESYWYRLSAYIHLNPVRSGIVERIIDYPWSSYHDYTSFEKKHKWINCEEILGGYGRTKEEQIKNYKELIKEVSGKEKDVLDEVKHDLILGSEKFIDWIQKKFTKKNESISSELSKYNLIRNRGIGEEVISALIKEFNIKREELTSTKRRSPNTTRDIALYILHMHTGLSNVEIGSLFNLSSSAVTKASDRIKKKIKEDSVFAKEIETLINSIFKV